MTNGNLRQPGTIQVILLPRLEPETFRTPNTITTHDMADTTILGFFLSGCLSAVLATARTIGATIRYFSLRYKRHTVRSHPASTQWVKVKVKVKITLEQATKGTESKGITLLLL